jgi:hypothetical protein
MKEVIARPMKLGHWQQSADSRPSSSLPVSGSHRLQTAIVLHRFPDVGSLNQPDAIAGMWR